MIMDHHGCYVMDAVLAQGRCPGGEGQSVSGLRESRVYTGGSQAGAWKSRRRFTWWGEGVSKIWTSGTCSRMRCLLRGLG